MQFPNSKLYCRETGNRLNRGAEHGLEIQVTCTLNENRKAIEWMKSKIYKYTKVDENFKNQG